MNHKTTMLQDTKLEPLNPCVVYHKISTVKDPKIGKPFPFEKSRETA